MLYLSIIRIERRIVMKEENDKKTVSKAELSHSYGLHAYYNTSQALALLDFYHSSKVSETFISEFDETNFFYLAAIYEKFGDYEKALSYYSKSLKLVTDDFASIAGRGRCYKAMGDFDRDTVPRPPPELREAPRHVIGPDPLGPGYERRLAFLGEWLTCRLLRSLVRMLTRQRRR